MADSKNRHGRESRLKSALESKAKRRKRNPRPKPWREFEILLTNIHKGLAPGAKVAHNERVMGRSGRRRQVDILLTQTIGLYPTRIVVECRKYRRPVSIKRLRRSLRSSWTSMHLRA